MITRRKFVLRMINLGDRLTVVGIDIGLLCFMGIFPRGMIGKNNLKIGALSVENPGLAWF